jgi:hypothetical protein
VDEEVYPEHYRKSEYVKGNNYNTPDPFQVPFSCQTLTISLIGRFSLLQDPEKPSQNSTF